MARTYKAAKRTTATTKKVQGPKGSKLADVMSKSTDVNVKGIGKYASQKLTKGGLFNTNKDSSGLTRHQAYKLEQQAQKAQQLAISTKPEMIRALGQAVAMNTTGAQGGIAAGVAGRVIDSNKSTPTTINNLVGGGAGITNKNNAEEEEEKDFSDLPEYIVR